LTAADYPLHVQFTQLRDLPPDTPLPPSLHFRTIALTLTQQHLHDTGTPSMVSGGGAATPPRHPSFLPMAHRLHSGHPSSRTRTPPADGPFRHREEVQCVACGTWGHQMSRCSMLAKHALLTHFMSAHPSDADRAAAAWKTLHSTAALPASCPPLLPTRLTLLAPVDLVLSPAV
jgi:hypothetical protein